MSDSSLDSLDRAIEAERKTQPKLPELEDVADELDSDELCDVQEMTQPIERTPELMAALAKTQLPTQFPQLQQMAQAHRSVPPAPVTEKNLARTLPVNSRRPSSIAPVAMDVPPPVAYRPAPDATQKLRAQPAPARVSAKGSSMFLAASLVAGSLAVVGVVGAFVLTSTMGSSDDGSKSSAVTPVAPRKAEGKGVRVAIVDQPQTAGGLAQPSEPKTANEEESAPGVPVGAIPSVSPHGSHAAHGGHAPAPHATHAAAPAAAASPAAPRTHAARPAAGTKELPPPSAAADAPAAPPAPVEKPTTGTIVLASDPNVMTVVVDGQYMRVSGGRVVVSCGFHKVRAGISGTQAINVPCGGTTTL